MVRHALGIRWTMGDVSAHGWEALRLSVWGAWRLFGLRARYTVCINTVPWAQARRRVGVLPPGVQWHRATSDQVPAFLSARLDAGMSEGTSWKFAPLRLYPELPELALDNDCILWEMPEALESWLEEENVQRCLVAEDVRACFGRFAGRCGEAPRNSGIRGLHPGFDYAEALQAELAEVQGPLRSELDEQGLQVAALKRHHVPHLVRVEEVSICSPFPPHLPGLGRRGAHFVGLNSRSLPWEYKGRPASDWVREHWARHRPELYARVGLLMPPEELLAGREAPV